MSVINVSAGSQAVLHIAAANAVTANSAVTSLVVPQMQDITINNSVGVFRFKTLDSTAESAVTIPATNQLTLNCVVDQTAFFGTGTPSDDDAKENGLFGLSKNKTPVFFNAYLNGTDSGSVYIRGTGFIAGLSPTVNMDSPVWVTPVSLEISGDIEHDLVP
tara:strand:- start:1394 stop:1876 length:483 start_codon:yes stop_codon:yes gene_type:complete